MFQSVIRDMALAQRDDVLAEREDLYVGITLARYPH